MSTRVTEQATVELEQGDLRVARRAGVRGAPRERDGVGRDRLGEIQRARILAALGDVVAERGVGNATVTNIVRRSGVSRRTFYELFDDREDCLLAAFDEGIAAVSAEVVAAFEQAAPKRAGDAYAWREAIRAGLIAALTHFEGAPSMARLLLVESWVGQPELMERRRSVLERLIATVDEGRHEAKRGCTQTPLTAEGIVGSVLAVIHARLVDAGPAPAAPPRLLQLTNPLMSMIVLPYLGSAAARRELERPTPQAPEPPRERSSDPLRELEMRLTYRTLRVLNAVAANPGSSNRQLADDAGVGDLGQISKLLKRLRRLDLIDNEYERPSPGGANAWTLTDRGREVHAAMGGMPQASQ